MKMLFDEDDYRSLKDNETYEGKFVVLSPDVLKACYREAKYQLFLALGGFGCDPSKIGNAVFGSFCDEQARMERYQILGVATEEALKAWEDFYKMSRSDFPAYKEV